MQVMSNQPKKMGRPQIPINWEELDKLCNIQCTALEICAWFSISLDALERRIKKEKGMTFADYYASKKGVGKISLRRFQWQAAQNLNPTALIWLGKQYLGQTDKVDLSVDGPQPIHNIQVNNFAKLPEDELTKAIDAFNAPQITDGEKK